MNTTFLVVIVAALIIIACIGVLIYMFVGGSTASGPSDLRGLMGSSGMGGAMDDEVRAARKAAAEDLDIHDIKKITGQTKVKKKDESVDARLFKAGYFAAEDKRNFFRWQIVSGIVCSIVFPALIYSQLGFTLLTFATLILGGLIGMIAPLSWLNYAIRAREEETMYYLPLVIEQISIGVSSSLDVGPCISNIIEMANERDSHNPVTIMFVHVEKLIRSGLNLEDALLEVAEVSGMNEVKHAFMFLAQCARHGGEISKQLQELADSVMTQRQVQVEAKIASLPVKATGPLATVFAGFFALLFAGLLVRLMSAFGGGVGT